MTSWCHPGLVNSPAMDPSYPNTEPLCLVGGLSVLLIDRHALFCAGLVSLLRSSSAIKEVVAATGIEKGLHLANRLKPDVVSIDPCLPNTGPFGTARKFHSRSGNSKLLFLDESIGEARVSAALRAGVLGYWTKHASFDQILAAILHISAGRSSFCWEVKQHLVNVQGRLFFRPTRESTILDSLTPRETEVLEHLARGLSVKHVAKQLELAPNTVDNHKTRMMKKLGVHKIADLVRLAVREGLAE